MNINGCELAEVPFFGFFDSLKKSHRESMRGAFQRVVSEHNILQDFELPPLSFPRIETEALLDNFPSLNLRSFLVGYREEIPFERFVVDHRAVYSKEKCSGLISRMVSVLHTLEGTARLIAHAAVTAFKKTVEAATGHKFKVGSKIHWKVVKAQARGLKYSAYAVISSKKALALAQKSGKIGCGCLSWEWGTPYKGKRSFYVVGTYDNSKKRFF